MNKNNTTAGTPEVTDNCLDFFSYEQLDIWMRDLSDAEIFEYINLSS